MANLDDFRDGTAFIYLFPSDFKSKARFNQYARFMGQDKDHAIEIPIDSERAREIVRIEKRMAWHD